MTQQGLEATDLPAGATSAAQEAQEPDPAIDLPLGGPEEEEKAMRTGGAEVIPPGAILPQRTTVEVSQWQAMNAIATNAVKAGIYPKLVSSQDALARILAGRELGLGPSASLANLYVVNGRVGMGAALIGALIKRSGKYDYFVKVLEDDHAEIEFTEAGRVIGVSTFSMNDAQKAGVLDRKDSPWNHYPRNMLLARALTNGARWYCPDVFHGSIYTQEELESSATLFSGGGSLPSASGAPTGALAQGQTDEGFTPEPLVRQAYTPSNGDDEPCGVHWMDKDAIAGCKGRVTFFKRGKMRSHAHPLSQDKSGGWCNRDDVIAYFRRELAAQMKDLNLDLTAASALLKTAFPDLATVPTKEWRPADWQAAVENFKARKGK